jgi:hypothetical protein
MSYNNVQTHHQFISQITTFPYKIAVDMDYMELEFIQYMDTIDEMSRSKVSRSHGSCQTQHSII